MIISSVLLAIDFSPSSRQLVDCIAELRSRGLEKVLLVHVVDVRSFGGPSVLVKGYDEEYLDHSRERLVSLDLEAEIRVEMGFPAPEIVAIAREQQVSMIAVASRGANILTRLFLGSTAQDVIRTSPLPVMVLKFMEGDRGDGAAIGARLLKKVLLPLDASLCTDKVMAAVQDLAGEIEELLLFSVIERARDLVQLDQLITEREKCLNELKVEFETLGIKTRIMVDQGAPSPQIIDAADREKVSLILMAKRGESPIKELLLGSTAHAVVRRSHQPVLLIP